MADPVEQEQLGAGDLPRQRDRVPGREERVLGAVDGERRRGTTDTRDTAATSDDAEIAVIDGTWSLPARGR